MIHILYDNGQEYKCGAAYNDFLSLQRAINRGENYAFSSTQGLEVFVVSSKVSQISYQQS